ncbi:hypothetical protein NIES2100_14140 [Calothrix sp. NIES-2100]|nr:hypothetical protein NIES2100_14140 [Calothrix sp. NIES-2100]
MGFLGILNGLLLLQSLAGRKPTPPTPVVLSRGTLSAVATTEGTSRQFAQVGKPAHATGSATRCLTNTLAQLCAIYAVVY